MGWYRLAYQNRAVPAVLYNPQRVFQPIRVTKICITPLTHVRAWLMYASDSCTRLTHVRAWLMYAPDSCTRLTHVRPWLMYAPGSCTRLTHVRAWLMYAPDSCTRLTHVRAWLKCFVCPQNVNLPISSWLLFPSYLSMLEQIYNKDILDHNFPSFILFDFIYFPIVFLCQKETILVKFYYLNPRLSIAKCLSEPLRSQCKTNGLCYINMYNIHDIFGDSEYVLIKNVQLSNHCTGSSQKKCCAERSSAPDSSYGVVTKPECGSIPGSDTLCPWARHLTIIASSFGWDVKL